MLVVPSSVTVERGVTTGTNLRMGFSDNGNEVSGNIYFYLIYVRSLTPVP